MFSILLMLFLPADVLPERTQAEMWFSVPSKERICDLVAVVLLTHVDIMAWTRVNLLVEIDSVKLSESNWIPRNVMSVFGAVALLFSRRDKVDSI